MKQPIKILQVEDLETDADLINRELLKSKLNFERLWVSDKNAFEKALNDYSPDIILCDHSLPSFTSLDALQILKATGKRIPFIVISGTVSEEFVVNMMKEGVDDYIIKDRLQRLSSAITNTLAKAGSEKEKQRHTELLIKSEANLRAIFNNTDLSFILIDKQFKIISFNHVAEQFFKYQYNSKIAEGLEFINVIHESRREFVGGILNSVVEGKKADYEISIEKPANITLWFALKISPIMSDGKQILGVLISIENITDRKNTELEKERMTTEIIQHNKNLEQFAYIISHNLRSPVANIIGLSNMIQNMPGLNKADLQRCIDGLALSANKLDDTIIDLNYILQIRSDINEQKEIIKLNNIVRDISSGISLLINQEKAFINTHFSEADEFYSIKSYVHSIFYNLITNSIKYRHPLRDPVIEIKSKTEPGKFILIFKDNGLGINLNAHKEKVFGLYKKFHSNTDGKGMGLYLVKTQVEMLGGTIDVKSEPNQWTEFTIQFFIPTINN
ncbi:MAG: hypothetical protein JWO32_2943 [Bacteroidetes bacterium]|nr:hypothetical protein [Bacteroidota bacterium]